MVVLLFLASDIKKKFGRNRKTKLKVFFSVFGPNFGLRKSILMRTPTLTVSLERNVWVFFIFSRRQQRPSEVVCVEDMNVHRSRQSVILTATVTAERVDEVTDGHAGMIDPARTYGRHAESTICRSILPLNQSRRLRLDVGQTTICKTSTSNLIFWFHNRNDSPEGCSSELFNSASITVAIASFFAEIILFLSLFSFSLSSGDDFSSFHMKFTLFWRRSRRRKFQQT